MDAAAAIVISLDILHDGTKFLKESVGDLADEAPQTPDESEPHPLIDRVKEEVAATSRVSSGALREKVAELLERLEEMDWRLSGLVVMPVPRLVGVPDGLLIESGRTAGR